MKYLVIAIILISGFYFLISREPKSQKNYDDFAKCLASKQLTMYGAAWCSHCQNEKRGFGDAFKYVPYVECPADPKICTEKGITGYPTWIDSQGTKYEGEQGLAELARISSCPLP